MNFQIHVWVLIDIQACSKRSHFVLKHMAAKATGWVLSEKLGQGVRPASQNPYPIYDQISDYPYLVYDLTKNFIPYL